MTQKFNSLQKGLQTNPSLKDIVFDYPTAYLQILDKLFNELFSKSCEGIDTKVSETSPDLVRFRALISELEFAKYSLEKNMHVSYILFE